MGVSSGKAWASGMVRVNEVGVEKSKSEGWLSVSEGLIVGVVIEVVQTFKVSGVMVVMVVDLENVGMGMGIVTEIDGIDVMIVSKPLKGL